MPSTPSTAPSWRNAMQIPRPLQRLFDLFPLLTYDSNDLPQRSRYLTSSDLPTLYIFCTEEDARIGAPSFNPGCLKWQTLLRLAGLQFRVLPSTNHASPTGSLPFLLPPRTSSSSPPRPIPADKLLSYALSQQNQPQQQSQSQPKPQPSAAPAPTPSLHDPLSALTPRAQAYLSLVTHSLRNAWLHALYLDPAHTALLRALYIDPSSSSPLVRAALLRQLRRAAAEQVAASSSSGNLQVVSSSPVCCADAVDAGAVYEGAREALEALAVLLRESEKGTGWFFGGEGPGEFDAVVFSYTHLMMEWMGQVGGEGGEGEGDGWVPLGRMVAEAGEGELAAHRGRMLQRVWPEWVGSRGGL